MGRLYVPLEILISTILTFPSLPLKVLITPAIGHCEGVTNVSSLTTTMSRSWRLGCLACHLLVFKRVVRYSEDHLFQKCLVMACTRCHLLKREIDWYDAKGSGNVCNSRPIRKCPGVSTSRHSLGSGIGANGRLLRQASTCVRKVYISKVSLVSPITLRRWVFLLLTAAQ